MKSTIILVTALLLCGAARAQETLTVPAIACLDGTVWSNAADQCVVPEKKPDCIIEYAPFSITGCDFGDRMHIDLDAEHLKIVIKQ